MKHFFFLKLILIFGLITNLAFGQIKTKKIKVKSGIITYTYYVLKDDPSIKHGDFKKTIGNIIIFSGHYNKGEKSGIWSYYNVDNSIDYRYDYDNKKVIEDKGNACFNDTSVYHNGQPPILLNKDVLFKNLINTIRYPEYARENSISGVVIVSITVDTLGKAINYEIKKSVHKSLDDEALRVIKNISPTLNWMPGTNKGIKIESVYCLPVRFVLQ